MLKSFKKLIPLIIFSLLLNFFSMNNFVLAKEINTASSEKSILKPNTVYSIDVKLMKKNNSEVESMASPLLSNKAKIIVDSNGDPILNLFFNPTNQIMDGRYVYITNLKFNHLDNDKLFYKSDFLLNEDNSGIANFKLPAEMDYINQSLFPVHIYSNVMDNSAIIKIDWSTIKITDFNFKEELQKKVNQSKNKLNSIIDDASYNSLNNLISESENILKESNSTTSDYLTKYLAINEILMNLKTAEKKLYEPNKKYWLPVKSIKDYLSDALVPRAILKTDNDNNAIVTFNFIPYDNFNTEIYVKSASMDPKLNLISDQNSKLNDKNLEFSFKIPKDSKIQKKYKINLEVFEIVRGKEFKNDSLSEVSEFQLDWNNLSDGSDVRKLKETISTLKKLKKDDYTKESFLNFEKELNIVSKYDKNTPQNTIDNAIIKLNELKEKLWVVENTGHSRNIQLGIDKLDNPYTKYAEDSKKPWAGSRLYFGKENDLWKLLDKNTGLIIKDTLIEKKTINKECNQNIKTTWENCDLRKELNNDYLNNQFSNFEKNIMKKVSLENSLGETTDDYIYILDKSDYKNPNYGFTNDYTRIFRNQYDYSDNKLNNKYGYFTRTLENGFLGTTSISVNSAGEFLTGWMCPPVNSPFMAISPALQIDNSKIIFSKERDFLPEGLKKINETENNNWNLVLLDESKNISIDEKNSKISDNLLKIPYTQKGADYISAFILNKNNDITFYGKINSENNILSIELPKEFNSNENELYILAEGMSNGTNCASKPLKLNISNLKKVSSEDNNSTLEEKNIDPTLESANNNFASEEKNNINSTSLPKKDEKINSKVEKNNNEINMIQNNKSSKNYENTTNHKEANINESKNNFKEIDSNSNKKELVKESILPNTGSKINHKNLIYLGFISLFLGFIIFNFKRISLNKNN